jgi:hypothetical protein
MNFFKSLLLLLFTFTFNFATFSQTSKDSVFLIKYVDEMADKTYYFTNRKLVVSNDEKTVGFGVEPFINDNLTFGFLSVKIINLGTCNDNDEIIILFENGEKIIKKSWKDFNCEGVAYFDMEYEDLYLLKSQQISKIRITNGYTYQSFTGNVKQKDKRYFIQFLYSLNNGLFIEQK